MGLDEIVKCFEGSKTRDIIEDSEWMMFVCNLYFVLENEFLKLRDQKPVEGTTAAHCKLMLQSLRLFKNMVSEQCVSVEKLYSLSAERRFLSIPMRLFSEIYFDSIAFDPETEEPLERGSGPISVLYAETQSIATIHPLLLSKKGEKANGAPPDKEAKSFLSLFPSPPPKKPSKSICIPNSKSNVNSDTDSKYPIQSYSVIYPNQLNSKSTNLKRPVEKNLSNLISKEEASPDDWAASIALNKKEIEKDNTLEFKCATINYVAMDSLLCSIESGKVGIRKLVMNRCIVGEDGVKVIVAHCKEGHLPCAITMRGCTISSKVKEVLLGTVPGLEVEDATYDFVV